MEEINNPLYNAMRAIHEAYREENIGMHFPSEQNMRTSIIPILAQLEEESHNAGWEAALASYL